MTSKDSACAGRVWRVGGVGGRTEACREQPMRPGWRYCEMCTDAAIVKMSALRTLRP